MNAVFVQLCSSDAAGRSQQEVDIEHREPERSVSAGLVHGCVAHRVVALRILALTRRPILYRLKLR